LRELSRRHPMVSEVRGRGLAIGVELGEASVDRGTRPSLTAKVVYRAWELGLVVFYVGTRSNVLEITPPLVISKAEAQLAAEILDQAMTDVEGGLVVDDVVAPYAGW
jgi:4-aminobutyrate aminotransferase